MTLEERLAECEIFRGTDAVTLVRVAGLAAVRPFEAGDRPFVLGQRAEHVYVVLSGRVDLCLPISVLGALADVTVESKTAGSAIGWSAFVAPHRFRLGARVAERSELAVLPREDLVTTLRSDPESAYRFMERVAELISARLLAVQALWARELQRSVSGEGRAVPA